MPSATAYIDSVAIARQVAALPLVQAYYAPANPAYVYDAALHMGLNRLTYPYEVFPSTVYDLKTGSGIVGQSVNYTTADETRINALATLYSVPSARVVSAAVCTGLAQLAGTVALAGPFQP